MKACVFALLDRYAARWVNFGLVSPCIAVLGARSAPKRYCEPSKGILIGISRASPWLVLLTVGIAALGAEAWAEAAQAPAPKPDSGAAPHVAIAKKAAGQEHLALFNNICTPPPPI